MRSSMSREAGSTGLASLAPGLALVPAFGGGLVADLRGLLARDVPFVMCATWWHTAARNKYSPVNRSTMSGNSAKSHPDGRLLISHGGDVDDDGHRKGNGQPAVDLPNPFVPVQ